MLLERLNPKFKEDLFASYVGIPPSKYFKISIGVSTTTAVIVTVVLLLPFVITTIPLPIPRLPLFPYILAIPLSSFFGMLVFMAYLPKVILQFRRSDIDAEMPFFLIYLSTLSIVMPPLQVFERITRAPKYVFRETKREGRRLQIETRVYGKDPIIAIEELAKTNPHKYFRAVLEGYATAVRSGSSPVEYLIKQAEVYLKKATGELKARAEALSSLMDALVSVFAFATITLFSLSISNEALPTLAGQLLIMRIPEQVTILAYTMPLMLAIMFLFLAKSLQQRRLIGEYRQYTIIAPTLAVAAILSFYAFITPTEIYLPPQVRNFMLSLIVGREYLIKPFLLSIILIIAGVISAVVDLKWSRYYASLREGLRQFVKDLAELRRTGIAPEACVAHLTRRSYGTFTKFVRLLDEYIKTFGSLREYLDKVVREARDWITIALLYTLIESLEVGGGKPEVFDRYAAYTDSLFIIEAEKKSRLKILKMLPFVTAIIQFFAIISVLYIFDFMTVGLGRGSIAERLGPIVFSVLIVTNFIYGIIAGLLSEERLSAGFKYAAILTVVSMIMLVTGDIMVKGLVSMVGGVPSV